MKHTSRSGLAMTAVAVVLVATAGVAIAQQALPSDPANQDVKITNTATQLPFATSAGASAQAGSTFVYQGREIPSQQAAQKGLSCVQGTGGRGLCFGTGRELDHYESLSSVAAGGGSAARASASGSSSGGQYAASSSGTYSPLSLWEHRGYTGWRLDITARLLWFDIPGSYNDNASSYSTGNHTGYIYENNFTSDGGWLVTAGPHVLACLCGRYNDEASSRLRG